MPENWLKIAICGWGGKISADEMEQRNSIVNFWEE